MLADRRYCYPLTVTDHASRYLLLCEALESNAEKPAITAFERLFQERGLPRAIRSDNGVPFASPNGLFNLSKLSVWWLRLGIRRNALPATWRLRLRPSATSALGLESILPGPGIECRKVRSFGLCIRVGQTCFGSPNNRNKPLNS
jgi:hypothetical protein